ncbi:60S ribosomal protein L30 [Conglomerata obtusa]
MSRSKKIVTGLADQLPLAIKSGKHTCGYKQAIKALLNNEAQAIILTENYPMSKRRLLTYYAKLSNKTPILEFKGTNNDFAKLIDNFFRVGVITIIDQGEADLIKGLRC